MLRYALAPGVDLLLDDVVAAPRGSKVVLPLTRVARPERQAVPVLVRERDPLVRQVDCGAIGPVLGWLVDGLQIEGPDHTDCGPALTKRGVNAGGPTPLVVEPTRLVVHARAVVAHPHAFTPDLPPKRCVAEEEGVSHRLEL